MKLRCLAGALATLAVLLVASADLAIAKDGDKWDVEGLLVGKKDKASKDLSGIACATDKGFPRTCVIIDDELQEAQVVTLRDGTIDAKKTHTIKLIDDKFAKKPNKPPKAVELDGEGVAFANGYFYVMGSHGQPRNDGDKSPAEIAARLKASSKLIRFKLDGTKPQDLAVSTALAKQIAQEHLFDAARAKALEEGGITIEGVAVVGNRLYAGFRGPTVGENKQAVIVSANLDHLFGNAPAVTEPHRLNLGGGRGVRDLAPFANGILIMSGPVTSDSGSYSIHWWNRKDGDKMEVKLIANLPSYFGLAKDKETEEFVPDQWKPEALLPFERKDKGAFVLVLMDAVKNGNPHEFRIIYP